LLPGCWVTIASIASAIAAGLCNERMSTLRLVRATFRRARVFDRCGHASAAMAPASIADCTEARAMIRIRLAVFAAIGEPSSLTPSFRSMSAMRSRSRSLSGRQFFAIHLS
jgi:hypothetical protein